MQSFIYFLCIFFFPLLFIFSRLFSHIHHAINHLLSLHFSPTPLLSIQGDAALLRDQLRELAPPVLPDIPCTSSTKCTEGIRVTVHSSYAPAHSRPEISNYLFTYKITITNESHPTTVKLVSRRWTITDGGGRQREVIGQGVVGKFPEVKPGESFEYESACPLSTHSGKNFLVFESTS